MMNSQVFIVIPAYNEAGMIESVLQKLLAANYFNIVVVDDSSRDETGEIVKNYPVFYLRHLINRGQGAALRTGTEFAVQQGADVVIHFDADGQMSVEDIPRFIELVGSGRDVVLGSRFLENSQSQSMPWHRKVLLSGAKMFNLLILGVKYSDPQNGFRALSKQAAERLQWRNDRMAHCSEILRLIKVQGLPYQEIPVKINYNAYSLKKGQGFKDAWKIIWDLFINKF
jgi:glycosyltransferase involved in cell wall biosynthesis